MAYSSVTNSLIYIIFTLDDPTSHARGLLHQMAFQRSIIVVVAAAAIVLLSLPVMFLFLAYHTHKEHIRWREEHSMAVKTIEENQRNQKTQASSPGNNDNNSTNDNDNNNDNNRHPMQESHDAQPPV